MVSPLRRIAALARMLQSAMQSRPLAASITASDVPIRTSHDAAHGADRSMSFIERVKVLGVNSALGAFLTNGNRFDRVLKDMVVTKVESGVVECELDVTEGLLNSYDSLHGGATMTIIDVVGTLAVLTVDPTRAGVSVEVNTSFLLAAKAGERVRVVGRVLKTGKRLGFAQVDLYRVRDGALVATGRHTKAL